MTSHLLDGADGTPLVAYDFGGAGSRVLIAHTTGFHAHAYAPLAGHLTDRRHVFGLDLRAHGQSGKPSNGDLGWDRFASDLLATSDSLELGAPIGVGHSLGGAALLLAELARPGSFSFIYCYEPIVLSPEARAGAESEQLAARARRRRRHFASRDEALERFGSRPPLDIFDSEVLRAYVDFGLVDSTEGGVVLACDPEDEARVFDAAPKSDLGERLSGIGCGVHVARGESTGEMTRSCAELTARLVPSATLEVIPRIGHFGPLEAPAAVAASVIRAIE